MPCSNHAGLGGFGGFGVWPGGTGVLQKLLFVDDLFFRGREGEAVHPLVFGSLLGTMEGEFQLFRLLLLGSHLPWRRVVKAAGGRTASAGWDPFQGSTP